MFPQSGWWDELSNMDADELISSAFGVTKANAETWGYTDAPIPEPMMHVEIKPGTTSLMRSNAGYEMLGAPGKQRIIVNHNNLDAQGRPAVVAAFAPGMAAEAQTEWNKIHGPIAAEVAAKKKAYDSAIAKKKGKSNLSMVQEMAKHIPGIYEQVKCPVAECASKDPIYTLIQHLNDYHQWKREKIADWLETLDVDLTVHSDPVPPKPVPATPYKPVIPAKMSYPGGDPAEEAFAEELKNMLANPMLMPVDDLKKLLLDPAATPPKVPEFDSAALDAAMAHLGAAIQGFMDATIAAMNTLNEFLGTLQDVTTEEKEQD